MAFGQLMDQIQKLYPNVELNVGFLNYCEPNALNQLLGLAKKADVIHLVPLFLGQASHVLEDIPNMIDQVRSSHPNLKILQADVLGCSNELKPALELELRYFLQQNSQTLSSSQLLLLGRGSSMASSLQFIHDLSKEVSLPFESTSVAFWDIAEPSFEQALKEFLDSDTTHLMVQPLFLFPGILYDKCRQQLDTCFQNLDNRQYTLGRPLCLWDSMPEMIQRRMTMDEEVV